MDDRLITVLAKKLERIATALERIADSLEYGVDWLQEAKNVEDELFKKKEQK